MRREHGFESAELMAIVEMVRKDTSRLSVVVPDLVLYDARSRRGTTAKAKQLARGTSRFESANYLFAQFGDHVFRLEEDQVYRAAAAVLREVQTEVSHLLGRDWPQLSEPTGPVVTLRPLLDSYGRSGWFAGLYSCCATGELCSSVGDKVRW